MNSPNQRRLSTHRSFLSRLASFNLYNIIHVSLEGVVVRYDKELLEVLDLAQLHREILATLGVHVARRLIEKCDADIGELLEKRQPDGERRGHLLAARHADEWPLVAVFFERDAVILNPFQSVLRVAGYLAKHL